MAAGLSSVTLNIEADYLASPSAKARAVACGCLAEAGVRLGAFTAYYDNTSAAAFGLAVHITGDLEQASAACELGYLQAWNERAGQTLAAFEQVLLARVRTVAIRVRRDRGGASSLATARDSTRERVVFGWAEFDRIGANGSRDPGTRPPSAVGEGAGG